MNPKQVEAYLLDEAASLLEDNKSEIESVTGPIVLTVVNGAVKIADGVFNNLPLGLGGFLDKALSGYVSEYEPDLGQYEGQGIDALAALLKKIAAGISA